MGEERLTLGEEIGSGALARVVRVRTADGRELAGKILHTSRDADEGASERFAREGAVIRGLHHPNVVEVEGLVEIDGRDVLLMELVEGPTLAEVIARDAPLPPERVRSLARGIAAGLAAAHERGVIHRDLKPANVLVAPGDVPKIADFGMARASSFAGVDPNTFTVLGTPDYMAPETLEPLAVDARTDLYALGCIAHEMAAGRPPYGGATAFGVLEQHRTAPIPHLGDEVPVGLRDLVERLLAKLPADRPQSASAVVAELEGLARAPAPLARTDAAAPALLGRCARCDAPLVVGLDVCLSCRLPQPRLERGRTTVFVTGPGAVADKLDAGLRERLVGWIHGNPSLGLDSAGLARRIPRLPFVLVAGVSAPSGEALAATLRQLGLEAQAVAGGRLALPAMRRKAGTMAGRLLAVVAASSAAVASNLDAFLALVVAGYVIVPLVGGMWTLRSTARLRDASREALPEALQRRLREIGRVGPSLAARRHREGLRAVVSRALALRTAAGDPSTDGEIGEALDVALVATARLDDLDATLERADLREANAEVHALMRERDTWSARLLDLTATLESLRARAGAALVRRGQAEDRESLDELRAKIEALEEVQQG